LFTAVCISIDRFPQNTAPTRCLPFDGIGARHPGIAASAGSYTDLRRVGNLVFPFAFRSLGSSSTHGSWWGYIVNFREGHNSGNEFAWGNWPRHRASCRSAEPQYHQKVNTKLGPYSVENGLSKCKQLSIPRMTPIGNTCCLRQVGRSLCNCALSAYALIE
jgi:hypothetical protein